MEDEFESDVINVPALELATTNLEAPRLTMAIAAGKETPHDP